MSGAGWRTATVALAVVCCVQRWQSCTRPDIQGEPAPRTSEAHDPSVETREVPSRLALTNPTAVEAPARASVYGFHPPAWAMRLVPQPGETMRAYRDRILPIAMLAVAPQRARVARTRDEFGTLAPHQRAELDAAVDEAATAIENRVTTAIANGELQPGAWKPMTGVTMARDVLDIVDRGNTRFVSALTADQRSQLAASRFDFADYLLFSTHWEDAVAPH